ncbi:MAG TPA: hypothetical protein VI248_04385 [Kineosporiaceae bacterium]
MADEVRELLPLPVPSTEIDDVWLKDSAGAVTVGFEYGEDEPRVDGLRFIRPRAYRHRAESHCTAWHLEAYDRIVEIVDSSWVAELRQAMPIDMRHLFEMRHFMSYFDSFGCYEVVAQAWSPLSERDRDGQH